MRDALADDVNLSLEAVPEVGVLLRASQLQLETLQRRRQILRRGFALHALDRLPRQQQPQVHPGEPRQPVALRFQAYQIRRRLPGLDVEHRAAAFGYYLVTASFSLAECEERFTDARRPLVGHGRRYLLRGNRSLEALV